MNDTRMKIMEAIARRRRVTALNNGNQMTLAPHQMFERRGDLFVSALNLSKNWRSPDGNCAKNASGQLVCTGIAGGAFIYAKNYWRAAVMSTLQGSDFDQLPLPPASAFAFPDGTMPTE